MNNAAQSELDKAIADLCTGAIFFCMRSCKYSKVPCQEDKKTKLLCLRNLRFFKNNKLLDQQLDEIENATLISTILHLKTKRIGRKTRQLIYTVLKTVYSVLSRPGQK